MTHEPTVRYSGALTDPDRWRAFRPRPGDVFVCTPPKCGTTWTQTMVTMLLLDTDTLPAPLAELSPWVDAGLPGDLGQLSDLDRMAAALEARTTRRCLKTHTPADGIPLRGDAFHVAVYRHPVDLFFSLRKHLANMRGVRDDHPMTGDTATAFDAYLTLGFDPAACDDDSLAAVVAHYDSFVRAGRVPNLLVLHYADMLRDPAAAVARLADHVGVSPGVDRLESIVAATGLDRMRAAPERYAPFGGADLWHDPAAFFDSARHRSWAGRLTPQAMAAYDARIADLLPPAHRTWLENGGPEGPPAASDRSGQAVTVRITGRVQGVAFRAWTQAEARSLGLTGWVRNAADGSVEALLAGPPARVQEMLTSLHRGPPAARVRDVTSAPAEMPDLDGFAITA